MIYHYVIAKTIYADHNLHTVSSDDNCQEQRKQLRISTI